MEELKKAKTLGIYNSNMPNMTPMEDEEIEKMAEVQYDKFTSDSSEVDIDTLAKMMDSKDMKDMEEIITLSKLIQRRINGEEFNPYNEFPESIKSTINLQLAQMGQLSDRRARSVASKMILDDLVQEYQSNQFGMDLDSLLASIKQEEEKITYDIAKDTADLMLSLDEERRSSLEIAINKAKEKNDTDAVEKLESMKDAINKVDTLDDFKEFCKTVKIKKFDLEKPNRIFDSFNQKYISHKNNISNIADCPVLMNNHNNDPVGNLKYCLAFCKYCMNMSPDNVAEHTFMYYFIRNIVLLDRLNPRGNVYETMDEKSKKFYDDHLNMIKECISYIK